MTAESAIFYTCCDAHRRTLVRENKTLNGLDFLEVEDDSEKPVEERQRTLRVHLLNTNSASTLRLQNIRIDGGERVRGIKVASLTVAGQDLTIVVDRPGDFSRYTLRLVLDPRSSTPPLGFDPQLSSIEFSFKVQCIGRTEFLAEFDCGAPALPEDIDPPAPEIDYLARDYATFRRLLLERVAALVPGFGDPSPADPGVTVLEALADAADQLSYQQDAIASEAYIGTARRRVSVRRHARLVDYPMHDGANARTWAQILVSRDVKPDALRANAPVITAGTPFLTAVQGLQARVSPATDPVVIRSAGAVFETAHDVRALFEAHNTISFHTWSCEHCTLPRGSTRATLAGDLSSLREGDVVIFEEVRGPKTGRVEDADPTRRHAVRLTFVRLATDPLDKAAVTEIGWAPADALPFELVLAEPGRPEIAIARGNIVLCDHGYTFIEPLGAPPLPSLRRTVPLGAAPACGCDDAPSALLPPRFRPPLTRGPLTFAQPHDPTLPASASLQRSVDTAIPAITLTEEGRPEHVWRARRDLLSSGPDTLAFAVEIEADSATSIRFGDDTHGKRPRPGLPMSARYRVGNGRAGLIGADALRHIVHADPGITGVRNPLPATGAADPEDIEVVRVRAPQAFLHTPARAVTTADYAAVAETVTAVQRASAAFRWTGSFYTAVVDIDRVGGGQLDANLIDATTARLRRHALAGYDVLVREPVQVSVELELHVCAGPGHFRSDIRAVIQRVMRDFFHPDNFTFGQPVFESAVIAAAQAVPGVTSVRVLVLRRQGDPGAVVPSDGVLRVSPREIVRLDNDPNFAERGVLRVSVGGGK